MTRKPGTFAGADLSRHWKELHAGDREPWPRKPELQEAWRAFHSGDFQTAIKLGSEAGACGAAVANKAAAVQTLYSKQSAARILQILQAAITRGEQAVHELPDHPSTHYTLALVLGRYSQRISILKALGEGLAGKVRSHLERTLELEPDHAEAHVALGMYHAEIINKLGSLAAGLTYNASATKAIEHFREASRLAPSSPIVQLEHAHGLLLLDAQAHQAEAHALFARAADRKPRDAMEAQDVAYAKHDLAAQRA